MARLISGHSDDWKAVRKWFEERIAEDQQALEQPGTSHDRSNVLRGRIEIARSALALDQDGEQIEAETPDYGHNG